MWRYLCNDEQTFKGFRSLICCREKSRSFDLTIGLDFLRMAFLITFSPVFPSNKLGWNNMLAHSQDLQGFLRNAMTVILE